MPYNSVLADIQWQAQLCNDALARTKAKFRLDVHVEQNRPACPYAIMRRHAEGDGQVRITGLLDGPQVYRWLQGFLAGVTTLEISAAPARTLSDILPGD